MSGNEVMVFVVFLLLGYWIVSFFLQRTNETWHRVLNINPDASVDEIRAAYQSLIGQCHSNERKSKEITAAYQEAMRSRGVAA